jgi:hypothetical protein
MVIQDIKIFHSKGFPNVPQLGIWFENKPSGNPVFGPKANKKLFPMQSTVFWGYLIVALKVMARIQGYWCGRFFLRIKRCMQKMPKKAKKCSDVCLALWAKIKSVSTYIWC